MSDDTTLADLQARLARLERRVADLEGPKARKPAGEVWGSEALGDPYEDAEVIQS